MTTVTMIDAIRTNAENIPADTTKVAGYVTGTGPVPWDDMTWQRFPATVRVTIDQSPSLSVFRLGNAEVADVETNAGTIGTFVQAVKDRMQFTNKRSTIYGTDSTIAATRDALNAAGKEGWYYGAVDCWLADWNLNQSQASAVIGTLVHGITCRAVQWASPTSNPDTQVPGSSKTLYEAQVDLSVAELAWPNIIRQP